MINNCVNSELGGSGRGLFQGTILTFAQCDW